MRQQRILMDRIDDVVLSAPLPREIKAKYPDSFVAVLVKNYLKGIFLNNSFMDAISTYDNSNRTEKTFRTFVNEIRQYNFIHSFMMLPQERINYILIFSDIKQIKLFIITLDNE